MHAREKAWKESTFDSNEWPLDHAKRRHIRLLMDMENEISAILHWLRYIK